MSSAGSGKESAFELLFERYYRPLLYFFRRRGVDAELSRDLVQETFLSAYKGLDSYRQEASTDTWLFTIARNIWMNWLRGEKSMKRQAHVVSLDEPDSLRERRSIEARFAEDAPDSLASVLLAERRERLRAVVAEMPPRMRSCFLLRIDQGLKYREIAEVEQISIGAAKMALGDAKKWLKKRLEDKSSEGS